MKSGYRVVGTRWTNYADVPEGDAAKPEPTFTCERCAISWVTADGARCPGCERAERMERVAVLRTERGHGWTIYSDGTDDGPAKSEDWRPELDGSSLIAGRRYDLDVDVRFFEDRNGSMLALIDWPIAPDEAVTAMGRLLDPVPEVVTANPLRDASRRLVDELARYQRAGRGTPLPSEVVAAVEDVRAALEVGGE